MYLFFQNLMLWRMLELDKNRIKTWCDCIKKDMKHLGLSACLAGVKVGCVCLCRWKVKLCDPIRQVTLHSCEMDFHKQLYTLLSFGSCAFRTLAPKIWNALLPHILQSQTLSSFRYRLKTHYFQSAYPAP